LYASAGSEIMQDMCCKQITVIWLTEGCKIFVHWIKLLKEIANCVNAKKFSVCIQTLSETEYLYVSAFGDHFEINEIARVHRLFSEQMEYWSIFWILPLFNWKDCLPNNLVWVVCKIKCYQSHNTYICAVVVAVAVVVVKGKEMKNIYIAPFWPRWYTQSAQAWITQFYLQITPCLPFLR